eukprot:7385247-Prymnesium_polylepis.3
MSTFVTSRAFSPRKRPTARVDLSQCGSKRCSLSSTCCNTMLSAPLLKWGLALARCSSEMSSDRSKNPVAPRPLDAAMHESAQYQ